MSPVSPGPRRSCLALVALVLSAVAPPAVAGFSDTDVLIPAVARASGQFGAEFYSQIWVTNLGASPLTATLRFLQRDQSNTAPRTFNATLAAGETRRYDNAVEGLFGVTGVSGAVRVTAAGPLLVSSRTYNLPASGNPSDGQGLFFTGIPCTFAIGGGEAAQLQGVTQGAAENFRYNFGLVNVVEGPATVRVSLRDRSGTTLGFKDYVVRAWEALQYGVTDVVPGLATDNALLSAAVISGSGRVILYGTQIANGSNDSAGFEMSFKNSLLSAGGTGVTSLNGLTGAVTLQAGSNVTLTSSGNALTIAAAGGGGGLTLPYSGTVANNEAALQITNTINGPGIKGVSAANGVWGEGRTGVWGKGPEFGVRGIAGSGAGGSVVGSGVAGESSYGPGVYGRSATNPGIQGESDSGDGVLGRSSGRGVHGWSPNADGVFGESTGGYGVHGRSTTSDGLFGEGSAANKSGVYAVNNNAAGYAGFFRGNVGVTGTLSKGGGSFRIDHPLSPETRYLLHSFVESPDMMNIYNGNVMTDASGLAVVQLPEWFEALNRDFRYQLTVIGRFARAIIQQEIENGRFTIRTDAGNVKVSWQVTGVRKDPWANAHRIPVEEEKPPEEQGYYLHPEVWGQPLEKDVEWLRHPDVMKRLEEEQRKGEPSGR